MGGSSICTSRNSTVESKAISFHFIAALNIPQVVQRQLRHSHEEFTDKLCLATDCKSLLADMFENTLWTQTFWTALAFGTGGGCRQRFCSRRKCPLRSQSRLLARVVARWFCSGGLARNSEKSSGCPLISAAHCHVAVISHMLPANVPPHRPEAGCSSSRNTAEVNTGMDEGGSSRGSIWNTGCVWGVSC